MRDFSSSQTIGLFTGQLNVNTLFLFFFGAVFLGIILTFAVRFPNPANFQLKAFNVVLSLAAAGIGAALPGALGLEFGGELAGIPTIKAGGALALFVLVFIVNPNIRSAVVALVELQQPPDAVISDYFSYIDVGNLDKAWNLVDDGSKGLVFTSMRDLQMVYDNARKPLGGVLSRTLIGMSGMNSPPGFPYGLYRSVAYRTIFASDGGLCRLETAVVRATQDLTWRIFSHKISPSTVTC